MVVKNWNEDYFPFPWPFIDNDRGEVKYMEVNKR